MVGKSHPTVFNLVEEFKKEEADTAVMIAEIDSGKKKDSRSERSMRG